MNGILDRLFPANPVMGLLGDENMLNQARQQGLLGLAAGLLQAGGPSRTRTNIGQAIGSGLMAGQQMYNQAVNQQITQAGAIQKLQEAQRQRQQQELVRQMMPQLIQQGAPTVEGMQFPVTRDEEGNQLPGVMPGAQQLNQAALNTLRGALDPEQFKKVMESIKLQFEVQQPREPKTLTLGEGQTAYAVTPTGQLTQIGAGAPKARELPTAERSAALELFGTDQGLTPNQLTQASQLAQKRSLERATATRPQITVDTAQKGDQALVATIAKELPAQRQQAMEAARVNQSLNELLDLNKQKTFVGTLAPGSVGAAQFLSSFGVNIAPQTLANTREFQASTNLILMDFMGAMGGAKGFSKEESAILYDAFPKIVDDPRSRARIVEMLKRRNDRVISDYNTNMETWNQFQQTGKLEFAPVGTTIPSDLRDAARRALSGGQ
jgi:hypothetical protein